MSLESVIKGAWDAAKAGDTGEGADEAVDTSVDETVDSSVDADGDSGSNDAPVDDNDEADAGDEVAETPEPVVEEKPKVEEPKVEEKDEHGLGPKLDKKGKENRIPHSRVQEMVTKADTKGYERAKAEYEPKIQAETTKVREYEERLTGVGRVEQIMFEQPDRMAEILFTIHPRYREMFDAAKKAAAEHTEQPPAIDGTQESFDKRMAWERAQAKKEVLDEMKPITSEYQAQQRLAQERPRVAAELSDAVQNWDGFADNADAILKVMQEDRANAQRTGGRMTHTLATAYHKVMVPIWQKKIADAQVDREALEKEVRARVLAELKAAPAATNTTPNKGKSAPKDDGKPKTIEDVIKASMRTAGLK